MESNKVNEDNRTEFLKSLEMNVKDKKASLEHYNELLQNNKNE